MVRMLVILLALASGCAPVSRVGVVSSPADPITVPFETGCGDAESDHVEVRGAELVGRTLRVLVRHGGGCEDHDYRICGGERIRLDGRWELTVLHDAHGDRCEAELERLIEATLPDPPPTALIAVEGRTIVASMAR